MSNHKVLISDFKGLKSAFRHLFDQATEILSGSSKIELTLKTKSSRSLDQNAKMWAMLTDLSKQVQWPVNGKLERLRPEEWKVVMTAAATSEMRMAQGINGGFVFLGKSTSGMTIAEMSDLIEVMHVFGAEKNVVWSDPMPAGWMELADQQGRSL